MRLRHFRQLPSQRVHLLPCKAAWPISGPFVSSVGVWLHVQRLSLTSDIRSIARVPVRRRYRV
jgi:hypothetical protein